MFPCIFRHGSETKDTIPGRLLPRDQSRELSFLDFPKRRSASEFFGVPQVGLEGAGGLADNPKGWKPYRDYLSWLSTEASEQKRMGFEKMSRRWAKGSNAFMKAVIEDLGD